MIACQLPAAAQQWLVQQSLKRWPGWPELPQLQMATPAKARLIDGLYTDRGLE